MLLCHFQMPSRSEVLAVVEFPRVRMHVHSRLHRQTVRRGRERMRGDVALQKWCHLREHKRFVHLHVREGLRGP